MAVPNYKQVVEEMAAQYPDAWHHAHRGGPRTEEFVKLLVARLHQMDPNVGLNGKRGNPRDLSDDALCYKGVSVLGDVDPTRGNAPVTVIDFIGGAPSDYNGPDGRPAWNPVTDPNVRPTLAAWVQPQASAVVPPPAVSNVWTAAHEAIKQRMGARPVRAIAEQLCHSFPGEAWGEKRAGAGRGISPDTIARKMPDGSLFGVRVQGATHIWGTLPSEQVFEPVSAVDYLNATPVVTPPPDDTPTEPVVPPVEMQLLLTALAEQKATMQALATQLASTQKEVSALNEKATKGFKIQAKGGWPVGTINGSIDLKD